MTFCCSHCFSRPFTCRIIRKRVKKAKEVLAKADIALVIMDATAGMTEFEEDMICLIEEKKIPYLKVYNKMDLTDAKEWKEDKACFVSAKDKKGIWELKEEIGKLVAAVPAGSVRDDHGDGRGCHHPAPAPLPVRRCRSGGAAAGRYGLADDRRTPRHGGGSAPLRGACHPSLPRAGAVSS